MKALDFVLTPKGNVAIVKETNDGGKCASITYIGNPKEYKSAWWDKNELKVIDSLPNLLARMAAHPFGDGERDVQKFFPINK